MPSSESDACQRKTSSACCTTALVLFTGLGIVTYVTLCRQDNREDVIHESRDGAHDDCGSKATVVSDTSLMQRFDSSSNFSQAWSDAERKARQPVHKYMEKHHSVALYLYTQAASPGSGAADATGQRHRGAAEPRSLYLLLSEAIQVLRHSQVTCISTHYRTATLLNLTASAGPIQFSTFVLGSDDWNLTENASCFEVYTCFGADVTHYSASKLTNQVLIPPYEIFKLTGVQRAAQKCTVIYRLKSNLHCVYDRDSDTSYPISALPAEGFTLTLTVICVTAVSLLLLFVIVKTLETIKTIIYRASSLHSRTHSPTRVVI